MDKDSPEVLQSSPEMLRGVAAAINSMSDEEAQELTALGTNAEVLHESLPAGSPHLPLVESIERSARSIGEILQKYRKAVETGEITLSVFPNGQPCLDIHKHSVAAQERQQANPVKPPT
ncbi:hypothetical protein HY386_00940 [Candidatus Daviesbacteria bacterium]|nr:hypothetical protein [Candidatus Daviesbacteria bacterium]